MYVNVAAGFSLRFLSSDEFITISRKLRNPSIRSGQALQGCGYLPNICRSGGQKSLNLDNNN